MKSKETKKTNVARLLDHDNIKYELVAYEVDENDLSAVHVAESLGEDRSLRQSYFMATKAGTSFA